MNLGLEGENWHRELFIESSSFAVSAGLKGLAFLLVATPVGWVGLIIGGVAIVGVEQRRPWEWIA